MSGIIFLAGLLTAAATMFCSMFRLIEGQWPIWYFTIFMSWWWPWRGDSAATIIADNMTGSTHADWSESGYKAIRNLKISATVEDFCDSLKAEIGGTKIPLREWDRYVLTKAMRRWRAGAVGQKAHDTTRMAAEAIIRAYRDTGTGGGA